LTEDHVHSFPKDGQGCYCGARQCRHEEVIVKGRPLGYKRGSKAPVKKRCKSAAAAGRDFCEEHTK
jgi:hypothetical protein